jgi:anthranilate phosphoribosyltransferase
MNCGIGEILAKLATGAALDAGEATRLFESMLSGTLEDAPMAAAMAMMTLRGPTVEELVAGATVLRRSAVPVPLESIRRADGTFPPILDTCGTGGAPKTFNISTAAALVVVAAGRGRLVVVKHGGRSRSGRGSAEVLRQLGVNIDAPPAVQARCLGEVGICFAFAVNHHPAMKHASAVRRSLGFPTVVNMIGPLANPAGATRQVVGAWSKANAEKMAEALRRLGAERALVVTSRDGIDELTTSSDNFIFEVRAGKGVEARTLDPALLGLRRSERRELEAESVERSAAMVMEVLRGRTGAARDVVALNASAGLLVCDAVKSLEEGLAMAIAAIDAGAALRTLEALVRVSRGT